MELHQHAAHIQGIKIYAYIERDLKVLQICAAYKPAFVYGGPTMSVSMLSEQLIRAGVTVEVYATTANGQSELPVTPGKTIIVDDVPVRYFKRITKDHSHFSPALLKKVWQNGADFDLIHIHAWWNLVSLFSCLMALIRNIPVLVSPRGTLSNYSFQNKNISIKKIIHNLLGEPMLNKCHFHVTSAHEQKAIIELIKPKSITVLPNFVKLPGINSALKNKAAACFKLLFLSRIEEKKGLDLLIAALPAITGSYSLTIAGDGNKDYIDHLKQMATGCSVSDKINWVGFQHENKFEILKDHDLFVLPSHDENFGNVVIESLSTGTPVLISEQVGLADYVKENNMGWICQTKPGSIADAINKIMANGADDLLLIRRTAPDIIYHDFDENNLVNKYIDMYHQIIKR